LSIKARKGSTKFIFIDQEAYSPEVIASSFEQFCVTLSPNPTTGWFTLSSEEPVKLEIYNLSGKEIYSFQEDHLEKKIDLSNQPKGVYLLRIKTKTGVYTEKIVRE